MVWKKLAFTDEMLTNPMTTNLDMAGYQVNGLLLLSGQNSNSWVELHGGSSVYDAEIMIFGKDTGGLEGDITFMVPNAAKNNQLTAMTVNGASDTPIVDVHYGLDMNDNNIEAMCALKAHDALGIAVFDSGDSDRLVLCPTGYGFLTNAPVDMNKQEIEAMCFENLASAPATPGAAQIYYDTVDDHLYVNVV